MTSKSECQLDHVCVSSKYHDLMDASGDALYKILKTDWVSTVVPIILDVAHDQGFEKLDNGTLGWDGAWNGNEDDDEWIYLNYLDQSPHREDDYIKDWCKDLMEHIHKNINYKELMKDCKQTVAKFLNRDVSNIFG